MVWGQKIIKWRWLNDPKTIEKPSSPVIKKVVNGDGQKVAKPSKTIDANGSRGKKPSHPIAPEK